MIKKNLKFILLFFFGSFIIIFSPAFVSANNNGATIRNDIDVSASTGNNQSNNGDITTGDAFAQVKVENTVNSQQIEPTNTENNSNQASINNNVNISVSTGNKQSDQVDIITGESSAKIDVENTINGQQIELINIEKTSKDGNQNIKVDSEINVKETDGLMNVKTETTTDQGTEKNEYTVNLDNSKNDTEKNIFESVGDWIKEFINNLVETVNNIF